MRQRRVVTGDGVAIAYAEFGPRTGRAVLMVHGLCAGGRQFYQDAAWFAARDYRVLVPDLRGHGASGRPRQMVREAFSIDRMAADMLAVLDHAGLDRVDWVGNSLGGILALHLAGVAPQRLRTLVMFGTALRLALPAAAARSIPFAYNLFGRRLVALVGGVATTGNREARPLVRQLLAEVDAEAAGLAADNVRNYDFRHNAFGFSGPMLLIRGDADRLVNMALRDDVARLAARPNVTLIGLPGAGHCANLDKPDALRQALEAFWALHPRVEAAGNHRPIQPPAATLE